MTTVLSHAVHSLMLRLSLMLMALGGLIVAVFLVSWLVFQTIDTQMAALTKERMPELRGSAGVVKATDATRALLTSALAAKTSASLRDQSALAEQIFAEFHAAFADLPSDGNALTNPALVSAESAVSDLFQARFKEYAELARMAETIQSASEFASAASSVIEEANDRAFFDMTISGENTITVIDETLTQLVDEDFNQFQAALSIRGEINLLAGLALAYTQGTGSQISTIIADLAKSATDRLTSLLQDNQDKAAFETVVPVLRDAIQTFTGVFEGGNTSTDASEILAARLAVDTVLSPALDDIFFNLTIASEDAKDTNRTSLTHLLEQEVEGMRVNATLDAATKHFFALLLQVSTARSVTELDLRQSELAAQAQDVTRLKTGSAFETQEDLGKLLKLADPDTGIAAAPALLCSRLRTMRTRQQKPQPRR